jgi:hypothetical protein
MRNRHIITEPRRAEGAFWLRRPGAGLTIAEWWPATAKSFFSRVSKRTSSPPWRKVSTCSGGEIAAFKKAASPRG